MAAKDVYFASDARDRMLRGVNILANAVSITGVSVDTGTAGTADTGAADTADTGVTGTGRAGTYVGSITVDVEDSGAAPV